MLLATRLGIPTAHSSRDAVEAGLLMSYGTDVLDRYRQVAAYAGRTLKGEKPADLPVVQSTKFEFVINLQTARALGLDIPPTLLPSAASVVGWKIEVLTRRDQSRDRHRLCEPCCNSGPTPSWSVPPLCSSNVASSSRR
jgi:hypothetical protein